ncbi:MAG TPA: 3-oxoadipate enol-lactonase [Solirubrobacteraceae bacterium]|nr:3-oxoadipate enol-lactonase [Solirubrobacteraceae bacterium]
MTTLHYSSSGPRDAPVLLMGGSIGTSLDMWDRQLPLGDSLRLVRFDHRGHGRSPNPSPATPWEIEDLAHDVLELMDALALERAHYCGLSLGGMVGMWLAANAPDRIDRLILLCTSPHMPPPSLWQERSRAVLEAGSVEPLADAALERWLTPAFADANPSVRAWVRSMLVDTPATGYAACCGAIERMDLREALPSIAAPTLVVSGAQDPSTPPAHQQLIAEAVPGARHEILDPAAHLAAVERPDEINRLILEHVT